MAQENASAFNLRGINKWKVVARFAFNFLNGWGDEVGWAGSGQLISFPQGPCRRRLPPNFSHFPIQVEDCVV